MKGKEPKELTPFEWTSKEVNCKHVKREGESCTLNNNCTYPNCTPKEMSEEQSLDNFTKKIIEPNLRKPKEVEQSVEGLEYDVVTINLVDYKTVALGIKGGKKVIAHFYLDASDDFEYKKEIAEKCAKLLTQHKAKVTDEEVEEFINSYYQYGLDKGNMMAIAHQTGMRRMQDFFKGNYIKTEKGYSINKEIN